MVCFFRASVTQRSTGPLIQPNHHRCKHALWILHLRFIQHSTYTMTIKTVTLLILHATRATRKPAQLLIHYPIILSPASVWADQCFPFSVFLITLACKTSNSYHWLIWMARHSLCNSLELVCGRLLRETITVTFSVVLSISKARGSPNGARICVEYVCAQANKGCQIVKLTRHSAGQVILNNGWRNQAIVKFRN